MREDVIVIGGGAAGMMAAVFAARQGAGVLLMEKNGKLGRKLRITGKGRCNLTNNCDRREFMENIPGDGRFLYSALSAFPPQEVMAFFEENGLPLKTERGRRVFPQSDNANDVADLLARLCRRSGVRILTDEAVGISVREQEVRGVKTRDGLLSCGACIVATGGLSYPLTGSTGDGFRFAKSLGHSVRTPRPSLVPLECRDACCARLQGLTLRNVELRILEDGKLLCREQGEMLFTHFGISGPLVLSASSRMRSVGERQYRAEIDLKPALDEETLDRRLQRDLKTYQNRSLSNALTDLLPHALIPEVLEQAEAPETLQANSVTREMRLRLLHTLKAFRLEITGTRPLDEAIITSGGVALKELDPRSMQSKLVRGLYFAGEVLDLDAYTGGYNLQIAWMTGRLAGISAGSQYRDLK
ncbi:MAG: NAD(P)/FAD-dependent oxidoreductase [Oscillospiraceae bacterium]|nr:NAD(P)/FAD-dependent oxidoreductase [Oscillospiraceae bacterium]